MSATPTQYIVYKEFQGTIATGEKMIIKKGEKFRVVGKFIATNSEPPKAICRINSQNAYEYFADNSDGRGKERGELVYAIAFSPREQLSKDGHFQRFSEYEIETLRKKWSDYLMDSEEVILFNYNFYHATIEELEQMAKDIHIKIKKN